FSQLLRRYSHPPPWNWLVPFLLTTATWTAPSLLELASLAAEVTLNSCTSSMRGCSAEKKLLPVLDFSRLSWLLMPSTVRLTAPGGRPLNCELRGEPVVCMAGMMIAKSCALRLAIGICVTCCPVTWPEICVDSVSRTCCPACTSTVWLDWPTLSSAFNVYVCPT